MKRMKHRSSFRVFSTTFVSILSLVLPISIIGCAITMENAIYKGDIESVRTLINKGENVNVKYKSGYIPLHIATICNERDIVRLLLENDADINAKDTTSSTALHHAVIDGYTDIVEVLLKNGADLHAENWRDSTPLHLAALYGHSDLVQLLINKGANPKAVNKSGETPLKIAEQRGYQGIALIIRKAMDEKHLAAKPPITSLPIPKPLVTVHPALKAITPQRWAVVIGISNYQDGRIPPLRYAHVDAESFYYWLISPEGGGYPPSHVKLMTNEEATGVNIKNALFEWLKQAIEEDVVVIFFAGHGSPESPDFTDNLFLLPHDIQYDKIAATGFPMWDIKTALERFIKANKVVIIADTCHSGGVGKEYDIARRASRSIRINPIVSGFQDLSEIGDGICVISASEEKQFSQEDVKWGGGHGVFTHFLLQGLTGEADYNKDKRVNLGELIPYLSEKVRRATRNAQCPTVAGKFDPALSIER